MHHDPFTQFGQLALMAVTGAFAGLARILSLYSITFDKRKLLANVIGGAVVAIISGGLYVFFFPEKEANILIIAAISSAAGALGFPWVMALVKERVEDRLGLQDDESDAIFNVVGPVVSETVEALKDDGKIDAGEALRIGFRIANGVNFKHNEAPLQLRQSELFKLAEECGVIVTED